MAEIPVINPIDIPEKDLPLIVLSDNLFSIIGWYIKKHTKGYYNHAMLMHRKDYFASQNFTYRERPVTDYMSPNFRLKFICIKDPAKRQVFKEVTDSMVKKDLSESAWRRRYDFLGILGQWLNINELNDRFANYCSERVARYMRAAGFSISSHPSPSDINTYTKFYKDIFGVYGLWFAD